MKLLVWFLCQLHIVSLDSQHIDVHFKFVSWLCIEFEFEFVFCVETNIGAMLWIENQSVIELKKPLCVCSVPRKKWFKVIVWFVYIDNETLGL